MWFVAPLLETLGKMKKGHVPDPNGTCACTVLRRIWMIPRGWTAGGNTLGQTTPLMAWRPVNQDPRSVTLFGGCLLDGQFRA